MIVDTTVNLFNAEKQNLGIESEAIPVKLTILSSELAAVRELIEGSETIPSSTECMVYLKSGIQLPINTPYEDMRKALLATSPLTYMYHGTNSQS